MTQVNFGTFAQRNVTVQYSSIQNPTFVNRMQIGISRHIIIMRATIKGLSQAKAGRVLRNRSMLRRLKIAPRSILMFGLMGLFGFGYWAVRAGANSQSVSKHGGAGVFALGASDHSGEVRRDLLNIRLHALDAVVSKRLTTQTEPKSVCKVPSALTLKIIESWKRSLAPKRARTYYRKSKNTKPVTMSIWRNG